jgi:hypothetical protein
MSYNDFRNLTRVDNFLSSYLVPFNVKTVFEKYEYFMVFAIFWVVLYIFLNMAAMFKSFMEKIVSSDKLFNELVKPDFCNGNKLKSLPTSLLARKNKTTRKKQ